MKIREKLQLEIFMNEDIEKATKILNQGGIVIFPTDTAYGIGCRIDKPEAISRLFNLRKRPLNQPVLVLVNGFEMAQEYLEPLDEEVKELMQEHWPGALTIVYNCKVAKVPSSVRGGGKTLGVRMSNHSLILKLIKEVGVPILGPSANFHGENTPYRLEEINPKLIKLADYVMKGDSSKILEPSTVIDCTKKPWKILREGAISISNFKFQISNSEQNVVLLIDTSSNKEIIVGLEIGKKKYISKKKIGIQKAQIALPMIEELLNQNSIDLKSINQIRVNTGPGSFTGLRVGISIANTLGFFLSIPVNGKKIGQLAQPQY